MTKIAIIVGSTRQSRETIKYAKWIENNAKKFADTTVLDLQDYPMPFFDEPVNPRFNPNRKPDKATAKWLDDLSDYDGYIVVTPEYNRSIPGVLKNAIDVTAHQLDNKPVALAAHGSSGGAQAVATLRLTLPGVGAITVPTALFFTHNVATSIDQDGKLDNELSQKAFGPETQLEMLIQLLVRYAKALKNV